LGELGTTEGDIVNSTTKYVIRTDIQFGAMEKIDIDALQNISGGIGDGA